MIETITHDFEEETPESKARWFHSLSLSERVEMLNLFTDLVLENNPTIVERRNDQPVVGRIRVLSKA
ncbi:MAG: hypothetical protein ACRD4L_14925 [Pyrinomonadaceae bacterium]